MRNNLIFFSIIIATFTLTAFYFKKGFFKNILESKKIIEIRLVNNENISENYFFSKVNIKEGQSFWLFNPFTLKKDLEDFNEIESFEFNLSWEGILTIKVKEVQPFMKWKFNNIKNYIDIEGEILKFNIEKSSLKLPELVGEEANKNITSFNEILVNNKISLSSISKINFIKNIGWKVQLIDNNCLYLPLKKLDKIINIFQNIKNSELYEKYNFFDFRVNGRVYMSNSEC